MTDKDLFISDLFFNMVSYYRHGSATRQNVNELAGVFSSTLSDMGIEKSPSELVQDFFKRV